MGFLLEDAVQSLACWHRDITARVQNDPRQEGTLLVVTGKPQPVIEDDLMERIRGAEPVELGRECELTALPAQELVNVLSPAVGQPRAPLRPADAQSVELTLHAHALRCPLQRLPPPSLLLDSCFPLLRTCISSYRLLASILHHILCLEVLLVS